jgi:hypothetical protein
MQFSLIRQAAFLGASAFALATSAAFSQQEWTSFQVGTLSSYSFTHTHLDDGRFLFGTAGQISVQDSFDSETQTTVAKPNGLSFDPSFIATHSASQALIGGGGYSGPSGLYVFDPSTPAAPITTPALTTLQNYSAVYWKHPTSTREGWLVVGTNASGGNSNLTFVSADGLTVGAVTGTLSDYSGGMAATANGDIYAVRSSSGPSEGQVIKFTANQIDAAMASLATTPAPLALNAAEVIYQGSASGSLAVDSLSRIWLGGYQIDYLQAYDPASGVTRRFYPDHAPLADALGAPTYAPKSFTRNAESYVSFLANDGFYATGSDLVIGYKKDSELNIRSVQITSTAQTVLENAGAVAITVTITPAPTEPVTVPFTVSGSATAGIDYTVSSSPLTFDATNTTRTITLNVINDSVVKEVDETMIVKIATPTPVAAAGLGAPDSEVVTITIRDNDAAPIIARNQTFPTLRVGRAFSQTVQLAVPSPAATRWTKANLPPGLDINSTTGVISGTPTAAGEYDQVLITASNTIGSSTSVGFVMRVESVPSLIVGNFSGIFERTSSNGGFEAYLTLTTTSRASYSGKLIIGTKSYNLAGNLAVSPTGNTASGGQTIRHNNQDVPLTFTINSTTGILTGSLDPSVSLTGIRSQTGTTRTGIYNFRVARSTAPPENEPQGASYASMTLSPLAIAKIAGRLADGSVFTASSPLGTDGRIFIYQPLYTAPGRILGSLTLASDNSHTITGNLTWTKPPQTSGAVYRSGWATPIPLVASGGKYRPAVGATLPLDASPSTTNNARLVLQDGGISANPINVPFRLLSPTTLSIAAPQRLSITNASGAFTGTYTDGTGATKRTLSFQGLLIPDPATPEDFDSTGYGYFILPTGTKDVSRSGAVILERP